MSKIVLIVVVFASVVGFILHLISMDEKDKENKI